MAGNNVIAAVSINPQVILSQQLGATESALYTVPAATSAKIAQGSICNVTANTAPPTLSLGATATSGGTFAAGTYYWKMTARSATGETIGSNEVSAAIAANGTQALSGTAVTGAATYNVYRGLTPGAETVLVGTNLTTPAFTDTGASGTNVTPPVTSTFAYPVSAWLSIVKAGGTIGDGTHRVLNSYVLSANDTLSLKDIIGGHMLGPGDAIAGYASVASAVDIVLSGTVHS